MNEINARRVVPVNIPTAPYDVLIQNELLGTLSGVWKQSQVPFRVVVISDSIVAPIYASKVTSALMGIGVSHVVNYEIPAGEVHKTLHTVQGIYDFLLESNIDRKSWVLALGGGVVGDTAGFAASTYLRGLPFVQAPTTLLAMVDASVGGKVGVNLSGGKNLVGSFYQPHKVIIDPSVLMTLPDREYRAGLAECVKHAILGIGDVGLFAWMEQNRESLKSRDPQALYDLLERNVSIKARVVAEDEREGGCRALLNLGHTFAHALESATHYSTYLHGEAVGLGMLAAIELACRARLAGDELLERTREMLRYFELPVSAELSAGLSVELPPVDELVSLMMRDKKVQDSQLRLVIPRAIGDVVISSDFTDNALREAWRGVCIYGEHG